MTVENKTAITPGAAPQDGGTKKIGGKYDTVEAAVEGVLKSQETAYHDLNTKFTGLTKLIEDALTMPANNVPVGRGGASNRDPNYDPSRNYGRDNNGNRNDDGEEAIDPASFIANPSGYLKKRDDRMRAQIMADVMPATAALVQNAVTVTEWKGRNPDLLPHERVVAAFMKELDPNLPLQKRLDTAGTRAREYIANVKGNGRTPGDASAPGSDDFVPPPGGAPRTDAPAAPAGPVGTGAAEVGESELLASIREANRARAARFGVKVD